MESKLVVVPLLTEFQALPSKCLIDPLGPTAQTSLGPLPQISEMLVVKLESIAQEALEDPSNVKYPGAKAEDVFDLDQPFQSLCDAQVWVAANAGIGDKFNSNVTTTSFAQTISAPAANPTAEDLWTWEW